jgi:hypothetical protein
MWEVIKPNNFYDYEFYTEDTDAWSYLTIRLSEAQSMSKNLSTGAWCTHNSDCSSECCSNSLSTDINAIVYGRLQCVSTDDKGEKEVHCNAPSVDSGLPNSSLCAKSSQCLSACCSLRSSDVSVDQMMCVDSVATESSCLFP